MSGLSDEEQNLQEAADSRCDMCLGQGAHTCEDCGGSCAAPGSDPVLDEVWYRCRTCDGMGQVVCGCVARRRREQGFDW